MRARCREECNQFLKIGASPARASGHRKYGRPYMKRAGLGAAVALMLGSTAMLGAQSSGTASGATSQARSARSSSTSANQNQEIVLTGCLMGGDQSSSIGTSGSTTGTSGSTTSPSS